MDIWYIIIILAIILISMILHEVMHGLVAYWLGDDTAKMLGRLSLNPVKHIDPFLTLALPLMIVITNILTGTYTPIFGGAKPVPFNPSRVRYGEWGWALVGIAGPLTNVLIAALSFGLLVVIDLNAANELVRLRFDAGNLTISFVLIQTILVNLGFFAFNMLPIPPLDGSRVVYAFAPDFVRRGMQAIERQGIILVFLLVILAQSFISKIIIAIIMVFIQVFASVFGVV
ncbi:site-2 protease family protein [Candidatus Saccharibacteria bacterium]|nr:site-2 protease family protein [Candidatus Saccharibacteria bacterium]